MEISIGFISDWLSAAVRQAAPVMLVGVGGVFTERSGILNIGLEGMMLMGALTAVAANFLTGGNVLVATICAMLAGGLLGVGHAYITVTRRANQIVSGLSINFFALGLTNVLIARLFPTQRWRVALYPVLVPKHLHDIPFIGPVIFSQSLIIWIAFVLPVIAAWVLYRTSWGLNIRAVGDHPHAVATAGLSVIRLKYVGVILSGMFAGLGGSALVLSDLGYFVENITAGKGFIALAAIIVGKWNPIWVAVVCLLFGAADAFQLRLQTFGSAVPHQMLIMLPYLLTIAALAGFVGRTVAPKTINQPYDPEKI